MTLGETVRAWREYRKLTVHELAHQASWPAEWVTYLEGDYAESYGLVCSVRDVARVAKILSVSIEQLVEGIAPRDIP